MSYLDNLGRNCRFSPMGELCAFFSQLKIKKEWVSCPGKSPCSSGASGSRTPSYKRIQPQSLPYPVLRTRPIFCLRSRESVSSSSRGATTSTMASSGGGDFSKNLSSVLPSRLASYVLRWEPDDCGERLLDCFYCSMVFRFCQEGKPYNFVIRRWSLLACVADFPHQQSHPDFIF